MASTNKNISEFKGVMSPVAPTVSAVSWRGWAIGLLLVLLGGGAVGAWQLKSRKPKAPPPMVGAAVKPVVSPTELPGLGYLPPSSQAILAIQLPQLLDKFDAADDPSRALIALGLPEQVVRTIESASGVGLKNVDQLVVGLGFEKGSLPPQMIVVVTTKQPYVIATLTKQANAKVLKKNGRTLYAVKASPIPEVYWWSASDRVLVATLSARDFDRVPTTPLIGVDHLRPELTRLVCERIATDAVAWFAASADRWDQYLLPYIVLPLTPLQGRSDLEKPAELLRSITVSIPNDPNAMVEMQIDRKSSVGGSELRDAVRERFRGEAIEVDGEGESTRLRLPFDERQISSLFARLIQK